MSMADRMALSARTLDMVSCTFLMQQALFCSCSSTYTITLYSIHTYIVTQGYLLGYDGGSRGRETPHGRRCERDGSVRCVRAMWRAVCHVLLVLLPIVNGSASLLYPSLLPLVSLQVQLLRLVVVPLHQPLVRGLLPVLQNPEYLLPLSFVPKLLLVDKSLPPRLLVQDLPVVLVPATEPN